ncbi:MAG TPA: T9SS type A sorting domain-containing protein, partial [Bacteroidia bacterium]|nr:T9SS type A sorting domain-containing protein [Bacteroidia bacterium]
MKNVEALTTYDSSLIAGGMFTDAGGIYVNNVAQWNGSIWDSLGGGLVGGPTNKGVESLIAYNGMLIAGGQLPYVNGIAKWGYGLTGLNQLTVNSEKVKVFPNPSKGIFTIQIDNGHLTIDNTKLQVEIYNELGETVYSQTLRRVQGDNSIDLSEQPNGIYLYRVISEMGESIASGKLLIQQ